MLCELVVRRAVALIGSRVSLELRNETFLYPERRITVETRLVPYTLSSVP